jgi:DNA replication protein DnaC
MTVHILTLYGDHKSGKTKLALQMLEYAQFAGQSVAYCAATEQKAKLLQNAPTVSVPCLHPSERLWRSSRFSMVVLDDFGSFSRESAQILNVLKDRMSVLPFAQIIVIR